MKSTEISVRIVRVVGMCLIATGAFFNPWVIRIVLNDSTTWASFWTVALLLLDSVFVLLGFLLLKYQLRALTNALMIGVGLLVSVGLVEIVLKTGLFDQADSPRPIWIPTRMRETNQQIYRKNKLFSKENPFGFTDVEHSIDKPRNTFRLAILGDSFIWGDGVGYAGTWNHKLQKLVAQSHEGVEVMHWGRNGWSTVDELKFLRETGIHYDPDLILIGFCVNDPDMGTIPQLYINFKNANIVRPFRKLFPETTLLLSGAIEYYFSLFDSTYGYLNWQNRLYSEQNLRNYGNVLRDLAQYCANHRIPVLFVLTPNNATPYFRDRLESIKVLLRQSNLSFIDTYDAIYNRFKDANPRQLWANPADGHPGEPVTELVAQEVMRYLDSAGTFSGQKSFHR